jgi:hypothetical protein
MVGKIVFWNPVRMYGFVAVEHLDQRGKYLDQYFFHLMNFKPGEATKFGKTAQLGMYLSFELGQPLAVGKKVQAINIKLASRAEIEIATGVNALAGGV